MPLHRHRQSVTTSVCSPGPGKKLRQVPVKASDEAEAMTTATA